MGRYEVRIDIQARAIWTLTKRGNNRDIRLCDQRLHKRWINRFDLTDKAKTFVGNPCPHHVAISSTQANGSSTHLRRHQYQTLIYLA